MALMYKMTLLINGKEKVICNTTEEKFNRKIIIQLLKCQYESNMG